MLLVKDWRSKGRFLVSSFVQDGAMVIDAESNPEDSCAIVQSFQLPDENSRCRSKWRPRSQERIGGRNTRMRSNQMFRR